MQYILLFIAIPIFIISMVLDKARRSRAAQQAETTAHSVDQLLREIDSKAKETPGRKHTAENPAPQPDMAVPTHTEGKHPKEIAAAKEKRIELELRHAEIEETRREIREMDLKKLRSAVVMSEILDRPVSLRRRIYPK